MVRTRRQAASQPEPAESDSHSVSDIPASGRRRKADLKKLGTLRPSNAAKPKLFLDAKKRRAVAPTSAPSQVGSQSPSEAKKRRRDSVAATSTNKRTKTVPAGTVNPLAMEYNNRFNKQARSTAQGAQPSQLRRITIELPQRRSRGSFTRPSPNAQVEHDQESQNGEIHVEGDGDLAEEEPEDQPDEQSGDQPDEQPEERPQEEAEIDEQEAGEAVPPSGQGNASPAREAAPRATRKSKARVPKKPFNERNPAEQADDVQSASQPAGKPPKPSGQSPGASKKATSEMKHLRVLWDGDRTSPKKRTTAEDSLFIEDDSSEDDDAGGEPSGVNEVQKSTTQPAVSASSTQTKEKLVQVSSKDVSSMCRLMGMDGWVGHRTSWDSNLLNRWARKDQKGRQPATKFGREIHKHVVFLEKHYNINVPQPLAKQRSFLDEKRERTTKALDALLYHVDKICKEYYGDEDGDENDQTALQPDLKEDIIQWAIPSLVLLLRNFFFLGGIEEDQRGRETLPKAGTFTRRTLQLLIDATSLICDLAAIIKDETSDDVGAAKSSAQNELDTPRKKLADRAAERITLHICATRFLDTLSEAKKRLYEEDVREARRKERLEREAEEKAAKEEEKRRLEALRKEQLEREAEERAAKKEEARRAAERRRQRAIEEEARKEREEQEQLAKNERRWEALCVASQRIRDEPGPVSSMWLKAQQRDESLARRRAAAAGREHSPELGVLDGGPAASRRRGSSPFHFEDGDAAGQDLGPPRRPWTTKEALWLAKKLMEGGQPDYDAWAENLGRRLDEVRLQAHLLRVAERQSARENGKKPRPWAVL